MNYAKTGTDKPSSGEELELEPEKTNLLGNRNDEDRIIKACESEEQELGNHIIRTN